MESDVIDEVLENLITDRLNILMVDGMHLSNLKDANKVDLEILKKEYVSRVKELIVRDMGNALNRNIPGFSRLCQFCEGVLDCDSDHA
jgi:hypothetical protein